MKTETIKRSFIPNGTGVIPLGILWHCYKIIISKLRQGKISFAELEIFFKKQKNGHLPLGNKLLQVIVNMEYEGLLTIVFHKGINELSSIGDIKYITL